MTPSTSSAAQARSRRPSTALLLSAALLAVAPPAGSVVIDDEHWTVARSPVLLGRDTIIQAGASVTIDPGVEVRMGAGAVLLVQGRLDVEGVPGRPVRFVPMTAGAAWDGIRVDGGEAVLESATLEDAEVGVHARSGLVILDGVEIARCRDAGVRVEAGALCRVARTHVHDCAGDGVSLVDAVAEIRDSSFERNRAAVALEGRSFPLGRRNVAAGNARDGAVVAAPWTVETSGAWPDLGIPYVVEDFADVVIAPGATLRLASGAAVRAGRGATLSVEGTLVVEGDARRPCTFEPVGADDAEGWDGLVVRTGGTVVAHGASVRGATRAVHVETGGSAHFTGSELCHAASAAARVEPDGVLRLRGTAVHDAAIGVDAGAAPGVDLGTASEPGGNAFACNGMDVVNGSAEPMAAAGNYWQAGAGALVDGPVATEPAEERSPAALADLERLHVAKDGRDGVFTWRSLADCAEQVVAASSTPDGDFAPVGSGTGDAMALDLEGGEESVTFYVLGSGS